MSKTYRFKLTDKVMDAITGFAKVHELDDRKDYKEAWEKWIEENCEMLSIERRRLTDIGYDGNIDDKMYKAGRYYFRIKLMTKTEPKERKAYIPMEHDVIEAMDEHIKSNAKTEGYTPATGYDQFCTLKKDIIANAIANIMANGGATQPREIASKFKKTYKNRYFIYSKSRL
jgi:hypothetical protein